MRCLSWSIFGLVFSISTSHGITLSKLKKYHNKVYCNWLHCLLLALLNIKWILEYIFHLKLAIRCHCHQLWISTSCSECIMISLKPIILWKMMCHVILREKNLVQSFQINKLNSFKNVFTSPMMQFNLYLIPIHSFDIITVNRLLQLLTVYLVIVLLHFYFSEHKKIVVS